MVTGMSMVWVNGAPLDENGYALLVQQSPVDGGTVNPQSGVYRVAEGGTMILMATPRPGYRFLYWLGDVADPGSLSTQVQLDAPKVVVAVYEREAFEELLDAGSQRSVGGGLHGSTGFFGGQSGFSGGSYPQRSYSPPAYQPPDIPQDNPKTVGPSEEIPEPTTICLLGLGGLVLRKKRG